MKIFANARDELNAQQRVAAQLEEVIVDAQALKPEQLFPERSHRRFDFILWRHIITLRFGAHAREVGCPICFQLLKQTRPGSASLFLDESLKILC